MTILRRARRLVGESLWVSVNQVLFSLAAFVTTAAVARSAAVHDAAAIFATYALESIAIAAARGYFVTAPLLQHPGHQLCRGDLTSALRRIAVASVCWLGPSFAVALWLMDDGALVVPTACWASCMLLGDAVRLLTVAFGRPCVALLLVGIYAALTVPLSIVLDREHLVLLLITSAMLLLVLSCALGASAYRATATGTCHFWHRERAFATSLAIESGGGAAVTSGAVVAVARVAPAAAVLLQVANQVAIMPALLLANGFAVPVIRRAGQRRRDGRNDVPVLVAWSIAVVVAVLATVTAAVFLDDLLVPLFGSAWTRAEPVVPFLALQAIAFALGQIVVTRYRGRVSNRSTRWSTLSVLVLGQGAVVVAVLARGADGLRNGLWVSAVVVITFWAIRVVTWERTSAR